jgi:hypothetical protein
MTKNPVNHERSKHIDIRYHFTREKVETKEVLVEYLPTEKMLADILTKGLSRDKHQEICKCIGLAPLN